ncbi:hypothetical protein ABZ714_28770 [Streptomyces sp. NPDC006798]|uniref:hypothetical protein n=1 Tax=Streptomyces sp. NPDC006798 TaxID=3155462 RepID=UPI0033E306D9
MPTLTPADPSQAGNFEDFFHDNNPDYTRYGGPYGTWIHPTLVRKISNGHAFQTVRIPYDTGLRILADHPALEKGPVIVNDFARIIVFLLPADTRPEHWNVPGTRFLRPGVTVELPPAAAVRCRDIHWTTPPATHQPFVVSDLTATLTGTPVPVRQTQPQPPRTSRAAGSRR